jgi:DNA-binding beta-propeller fold protein YncE
VASVLLCLLLGLPDDQATGQQADGTWSAYVTTGAVGHALLTVSTSSYEVTHSMPFVFAPEPHEIVLTPDGATAYVRSGEFTAFVFAVDLRTHTLSASIPVGFDVGGIAVAPDGGTLWVPLYYEDSLVPVDTVTNTPGPPITGLEAPSAVAITPDGTTAYVVS